MYIIIVFSLLGMVGIVGTSQSRLLNFKVSKKAQSKFLDAIICYLGGILLVILTGLF